MMIMASALNASLNGLGITATSDGTDVTFGGHIANGATLTDAIADGAGAADNLTAAMKRRCRDTGRRSIC